MKKRSKVLVSILLGLSLGVGGYTPLIAQEMSLINITEDIPLRVIVKDIPCIPDEGSLADITIQERRMGCLTESKDEEERTITLSLEGTCFKFKALPKVTLQEGFAELSEPEVKYIDSNNKLIGITMPYDRYANRKGKLTLSKIGIEGLERSTGDLYISVGSLIDESKTNDLLVAKIADYGVTLESARDYSIKAGDKENVSFTIKEILPDSLTSQGIVEIALDKGQFKTDANGDIEVGIIYLNGKDITNQVEIDANEQDGAVKSFDMRLPKLDSEKTNTLKFTGFEIYTSVKDTGKMNLTITGRGVVEEVTSYLGSIRDTNQVTATPIEAIVGIANQKGGVFSITEQAARYLEKGYIKLKFEGSPYIKFSKEPMVEVAQGDLKIKRIGWSEEEENTYIIEVIRKSTKASTLVIRDFTFSVDGTAPDGTYSLALSGSAISKTNPQEEIKYGDFISVTGKTGYNQVVRGYYDDYSKKEH